MSEKINNIKEFEKKYVGRLQDKEFDWNVLYFQEKIDPRYRRAQMRYIGGGGTGMHNDPSIIKAEHFTLSTMILPPGSMGPMHLHHDVEEVFFVIQGKMTALVEMEGETHEIELNTRDCIWTPPGYYRGVRNDGDEDALMLVMLGAQKPQLPTYPEGSELEEVRKQRAAKRAAKLAK